MGFDFKFVLTSVVLAGTAIFLHTRHRYEVLPPRQPFISLPHQLGVWRGSDRPISGELLDVLGPGDFLSRVYRSDSTGRFDVDLFMAYFPSQSTGDTIHSPEHCLPGSGWFPLESSRIILSVPGHAPFRANRYLVGKGDDRALVLYWYWAHDRAVASEYWAKFYLVSDAIRLHRSDGALVRVITHLHDDETATTAQRRLVAFAGELVPLINTYAPR
jgi:EpsI family protein